jgi:hypothetical protein
MWPKTPQTCCLCIRTSGCSPTVSSKDPRIFANSIKYVPMATSSNFGNMFSAAGSSAIDDRSWRQQRRVGLVHAAANSLGLTDPPSVPPPRDQAAGMGSAVPSATWAGTWHRGRTAHRGLARCRGFRGLVMGPFLGP